MCFECGTAFESGRINLCVKNANRISLSVLSFHLSMKCSKMYCNKRIHVGLLFHSFGRSLSLFGITQLYKPCSSRSSWGFVARCGERGAKCSSSTITPPKPWNKLHLSVAINLNSYKHFIMISTWVPMRQYKLI